MLFVFQFHIPFAKLWIWEHTVFTLLWRLRCPLNLSSEQQKLSSDFLKKSNMKVFWSENFALLGIKSVHGQCNSLSWHTDSLPYIVPPRGEPHCQLPSLLVQWLYQDRNTHAMLFKCRGVHQLKHRKSGLQIIALTGGTDLYFK